MSLEIYPMSPAAATSSDIDDRAETTTSRPGRPDGTKIAFASNRKAAFDVGPSASS